MWCGGQRFLRKLCFLSGKTCLVGLLLLIGLFGPFYCMVEEDLDHLFRDCQFARTVWCSFIQEFDVNFAGLRSVRATSRSSSSIRLLDIGVCAVIWDIWGERNDKGCYRVERWVRVRTFVTIL